MSNQSEIERVLNLMHIVDVDMGLAQEVIDELQEEMYSLEQELEDLENEHS